jgi:hypothetical protein
MVREWEKRGKARNHNDPYILEGLRAFAAQQAFVETERARRWAAAWDPIVQRGREVLTKKLGDVEEEMDNLPDIIIPEDDFDNLTIDND